MHLLLRSRAASAALALVLALPWSVDASNHREAPITALDHKADITDVWAFVSYGDRQQPGETPEKVTLILSVDRCSSRQRPERLPFDPSSVRDPQRQRSRCREEVTFVQSIRATLPASTRRSGLRERHARSGDRLAVVPPRIDDFDDAGRGAASIRPDLREERQAAGSRTQTAASSTVPVNPAPATMDYAALSSRARTNTKTRGVALWAGTSDDPFFIDLGGAFDTATRRVIRRNRVPGVLSGIRRRRRKLSGDTVSGFASTRRDRVRRAVGRKMASSTGSAPCGNRRMATNCRPRVGAALRLPNLETAAGADPAFGTR